MPTFTHHDEAGQITQSNTVYDAEGYDKRLHDAGQSRFVVTGDNTPLHHERWMVHKNEPRERPRMLVRVDRTKIKAGGSDAAVFRRVPPGARIRIYTSGLLVFDETCPGTEFELPIPVPCVYEVHVEKWPLANYTAKIEATV